MVVYFVPTIETVVIYIKTFPYQLICVLFYFLHENIEVLQGPLVCFFPDPWLILFPPSVFLAFNTHIGPVEVSDLFGTLAPHSNSTSQGYLRCVLLHYSAFAVSLSPLLSNYSFHWITFSLFFFSYPFISFKSTLRTAGSSTSRFFPFRYLVFF